MFSNILINLLTGCQSKMLKEERKREFFESAYVQHYLEQNGRTLIYVDEFHVSLRNSKLYNWSPRGSPAIISINHDPWTMSIIIAMSNKGIEGIKACTGTINSENFILFWEDIWKRMTDGSERIKNPVIIWDNASLHTWKETTEFMTKLGIKWVTITPYSPQLNAAEKIIGYIKNKLREVWVNGRPLSITILRKILDDITPKFWNGWINSSRAEIMNKMKIFE